MIRLTVLFEDPFWIGIIDQWDCDQMRSAKITFGSEPKDYQVYAFLNAAFYKLTFSPPIKDTEKLKLHKRQSHIPVLPFVIINLQSS